MKVILRYREHLRVIKLAIFMQIHIFTRNGNYGNYNESGMKF